MTAFLKQPLIRNQLRVAFCLFLLSAACMLHATVVQAQSAGTVQFASGTVSVLRNNLPITPVPARATIINTGDVIITDVDGHLQLTMVDGASISLRPGSRMVVEKYDYNPANPTLGDALVSLVTGTLRVFTGELVNRNKARFRMRTPVATLGIRGSGNVLAHFETTGTINHTLTGAHSVTSVVGGASRTLVSLPGQTIQVLPGQAPRFIPTPAFILAAASTAVKAASGSDPEKTDGSQSQPAAAAVPVSANATTTNPAVAAAQGAVTAAATTTVLANTTATNVTAYFRTAFPLSSGGFQGVFPQGGGSAVLNSAGQLIALPATTFATFLSGPGALPAGYTPINIASANVRLIDGTHRDGYRTTDGSVVIGRWEGGSISVTDNGVPNSAATLYALGPRSLSYVVQQGTPTGIAASFTGTTTYSLVGATAPTDAAGNAGRLNSASVAFNFSALTASLNAALTVNNQNLTLTGTTNFARDGINPNWVRSSPTGPATLDIACTGANCASAGYTGVASTSLAGANGGFAAGQYRIVPTRQSGSAFADHISGVFALQAGSIPTVGIVLPQSGTANLVWTGITSQAPTNAVPGLSINGTLQANFSNRTASFTANVSGVGTTAAASAALPTFTATATNAPIVGVGFSGTTGSASNPGNMTVTCAGSACAAATSRFGRIDGFFSENSGNRGVAIVNVGDSANTYSGNATFGVQPTTTTVTDVTAYFRTAFPLSSGGFQGVFPQGGGSAVLNSAGQLIALPATTFATFLSGPGALPAGYTPINIASANVRLIDGTHRDGYRTTDGSVVIGRWEGGSISVTDNGVPNSAATLYALGPRSLSYVVQQGTPTGIAASFTGTTTYSLVGATAPTDAAGNAGRLNSASVAFNFSALTASLNAALTVNNQNLTLTGTTNFARDGINPNWVRSSPTGPATLDIACTGANCASAGYTGVASTSLAGANGGFAAGQYRIVPTRQSGSAFADHISGVFALQAGSIPTVGIVLPQSGTSNLVWTGITNGAAPTAVVNGLTVAGTLQANFSTRTVSFTANVGGTGPNTAVLPTFTATATNAPIVGVGFSAATTASTNVGTLTVTCAGAACAAATSRFGRFDGFFSNNTGTSGSASVNVGDSATSYFGNATFGPAPTPAAPSLTAARSGALVSGDVATIAGSGVLSRPAPLNGAIAASARQWRNAGNAER